MIDVSLTYKKACAALTKRGSRLMKMHTKDGSQWFVIPGGRVSDDDAEKILQRANLTTCDDGLFPGIPQSWKLVS